MRRRLLILLAGFCLASCGNDPAPVEPQTPNTEKPTPGKDDDDDDDQIKENTSWDVQIKLDEYNQIYEGGGLTFNLYPGHIYSMSKANQDKFFEWTFRDIDMKYVLYNLKYRPDYVNKESDPKVDVPSNLKLFADFLTSAKQYRPNLQTVMLFADFPPDLKTSVMINGEEQKILDITIEDIYIKIAQWMYDTMEDMHEYGHDVDIISICNEPDWEKVRLWGYDDSIMGVGQMIKQSIPALEDILASDQNKYNLERPLIMGPSNITPEWCYKYIDAWSKDSAVWDELDIVGTHQYINGCNATAFANINKARDGKPFIQTEQHTNKGDNLGNLPIEDAQRGVASTSAFFDVAVNNGVQSWCYFVANMPGDYSNVGLMQIAWGGEPKRYKQYYVYKQLHSLYSEGTHVLTRVNNSDHKIIAMRTPDEDKVLIHVANVSAKLSQLRIDVGAKVKSVKVWLTDANSDMKMLKQYTPKNNSQYIALETFKYSLYSLEVELL